MFASAHIIEELTGKSRPSAQARWLSDRRYTFERRTDGTIALRMEELDAHTLSRPLAPGKRRWEVDLSQFDARG